MLDFISDFYSDIPIRINFRQLILKMTLPVPSWKMVLQAFNKQLQTLKCQFYHLVINNEGSQRTTIIYIYIY